MQIGYAPDWASTTDILLRPGEEGGSIIEDFTTGRIVDIPTLPWPAQFDATDQYVYSPVADMRKEGAVATTVHSAADGAFVTRLEGAIRPAWNWGQAPRGPKVTASPSGIVAVLESAAGCAGTLVHNPDRPARCIVGATGAVVSHAGDAVALARLTGEAPGITMFASGSGMRIPIWEVLLYDVRTGTEHAVAQDALSPEPPLIEWHPSGSHVVVLWPVFSGP